MQSKQPKMFSDTVTIAEQKAKQAFMQNIFKKYYEILYSEDPKEISEDSRWLQICDYISNHEKQEDNQGRTSQWAFITVNPKPGITVNTFHKFVQRSVKKNGLNLIPTFWNGELQTQMDYMYTC
jgi:hypothetical protein